MKKSNDLCFKCKKYDVDTMAGWENKQACYICQDIKLKRKYKLKNIDILHLPKIDQQLLGLEFLAEKLSKMCKEIE